MLSFMCSCTVLLVPAEAVVDVLRTKKNKTHFVPKAPRLSPKSQPKGPPKPPQETTPGKFFDTIWAVIMVQLGGFMVQFRGFKNTSGVFQYISSAFCRTFSGSFLNILQG